MLIKRCLKVLGLILFIYILSKINFKELFFILKNINYFYFLLALILWFFVFILKVLKWKILINSQCITISRTDFYKISFLGQYLGMITPGKLGEFWKAEYLTRVSRVSRGRAFYTTLIDRLIDLIIIIPISLISISVLSLFYKIKIGWLIIFLVLVLGTFLVYFLTKKENIKRFFEFFIKIFLPGPLKKKTNLFFDEFFKELEKLNFTLFLKLIVCGMGYYFTAVLVYYFVAISLGISVPFWFLFLIVALVWLILALPITVLGLGTREASYIFFFSIFGINPLQAVTFSLLILFLNILFAVPGAVLSIKNSYFNFS